MKTKLLALSLVLAFSTTAFASPGAPSGEFGADHAFPQGLRGYVAGTTVSNVGKKFECKDFPYSGFCIQWTPSATQFEPGLGINWTMAWDDITPQDNYDYDFVFPVHQKYYKAGVVVAQDGFAYQCRPNPFGEFCAQGASGNTEYDPGHGHAGDVAWIKLGPIGDQRPGL